MRPVIYVHTTHFVMVDVLAEKSASRRLDSESESKAVSAFLTALKASLTHLQACHRILGKVGLICENQVQN